MENLAKTPTNSTSTHFDDLQRFKVVQAIKYRVTIQQTCLAMEIC